VPLGTFYRRLRHGAGAAVEAYRDQSRREAAPKVPPPPSPAPRRAGPVWPAPRQGPGAVEAAARLDLVASQAGGGVVGLVWPA